MTKIKLIQKYRQDERSWVWIAKKIGLNSGQHARILLVRAGLLPVKNPRNIKKV